MKRPSEYISANGTESSSSKKMKLSPSPGKVSLAHGDSPTTATSSPTREERRKEKKAEKKARRVVVEVETHPPKFFYLANEIAKRREPVGIDVSNLSLPKPEPEDLDVDIIFTQDIRDAVLHMTADSPPASWLKVENTRNISRVVALLVPGLTPSLLELVDAAVENPQKARKTTAISIPAKVPKFPFITKFMHALPTKAPGEATKMHSVMSAFFNVPVTGEEKKKRLQSRIEQERKNPASAANYLLSLEQMVENEYPVPSYMGNCDPLPEGWVETPFPSSSSRKTQEPPKVYALDCEMCVTTTNPKALTHVTLLSYPSKEIVFDTLVKPTEPIVDYLTRFSGVTEQMLEGVETRLEDVQKQLLEILSPPISDSAALPPPTPILLGHSLNSDLTALRYAHPRCIDTSVVYHHPRGAPYKPGLAWLSKKWCEKEIQQQAGGHDPREDAGACVDLLLKKVKNGPGYGEFKTDLETIFERISRASPVVSMTGKTRRRMSALVDHGNPSGWHGKKADKCIGCSDDAEVVDGIRGLLSGESDEEGEEEKDGEYKLIFGRLTGLASALGWIQSKNSATAAASAPDLDATSQVLSAAPEASTTKSIDEVMTTLSDQLSSLYVSLPAHSALVIFTGHGDPRKMAELNSRRVEFETAWRARGVGGNGTAQGDSPLKGSDGQDVKWTTEDARNLEEETERAKRGLMCMCLKR